MLLHRMKTKNILLAIFVILILLLIIGCTKQVTEEVKPVVEEIKSSEAPSQQETEETKIVEEIEETSEENVSNEETENLDKEQEEVAEELNQTETNMANETTAASNVISVKNLAFVPSQLTIKVGETVTWIHEDNYKGYDHLQHKITIYNVGSSPILRYGDTFEQKFTKPGTYVFIDSIYPDTPKGKIIVQAE